MKPNIKATEAGFRFFLWIFSISLEQPSSTARVNVFLRSLDVNLVFVREALLSNFPEPATNRTATLLPIRWSLFHDLSVPKRG